MKTIKMRLVIAAAISAPLITLVLETAGKLHP